MRLPLAILTLALALAGCAMLGDAFEAAGDPATSAPAHETAPPDSTATAANPDPETTAANPDPTAAAAAPDPTPTPPPAIGGLGEQLAAAPGAMRPPQPSASACAAVTAAGPAREVDLDKVRIMLRGGDYRRGTFETNAAYRSRVITRIEAIEAAAVERTGFPALVFSLPIPAYRLSYDAERQELGVGSDLGLLPGGSAIGMGDFILVKSTERQIGRHKSMIAYGARRGPGVEREVTRYSGDQLGVIVQGASSMGWPASFERLRIPMAPPEGRQARQSLGVLFVAHLQEPYFATGEFIQEAKLDDLVEKRLTVEAIRIAIDCAAVYDRRTGRVIRQIVPAARPEPKV